MVVTLGSSVQSAAGSLSSAHGGSAPQRPALRSTGAELRSADVDGYSIAYREAGQGPALVLLHGFLCDSGVGGANWSGYRIGSELWHGTRRVRGRPRIPRSRSRRRTTHTASQASLTRMVSSARMSFGLSWGGILAQEFYRLHPDRLRCLILADTYAGWKGSLPEEVWKERLASCLPTQPDRPMPWSPSSCPACSPTLPLRPARRVRRYRLRVPPGRLPPDVLVVRGNGHPGSTVAH